MRGLRIAPIVLALALGLPALVHADVIHLKNGNRLEVEGWKDAGDAIEFMMGGGIIRISKAEIQKIDGRPTRGDFRMYTSGVSSSTGGALDQAAAVTQMADLLKEGEALFGQAGLSASEKAGAFRRLGEQWRGFEVPEAARNAYSKGDAAIQMAAEAFSAPETASDAKERVDKAKAELTAAQDEVKKLGGGQG
jgi:hypothetical protein